jgi:Flp pilus assembly protein TadG
MRTLPNTQLKQRFATDERGTTAIIFALLAVPMVAMIGLALDFSRANGQAERLQVAIDSAVLAAANAPLNQKAATAQKFFAANFDHSEASATSTFSVDSVGNITGVAQSTINMPFASMARLTSTDVKVDASATTDLTSTTTNIVTTTTTTTTAGNVPCIHVMDQSGASTFFMDSNSSLNASTCDVRVRSNNSQAMKSISSSNVKFKKIQVKGGALVDSGLTIMDAPNSVLTNAAITADPYDTAISAIANAINPAACTTSNTDKTLTGAVSPGTYCGTTVFNNATFGTGLYIIASANGNKNGRLRLTGNINGNAGVSFFFADNKAQLDQYQTSEQSKLKAPVDGATKGLLFFEKSNRGNAYSLTIASCNKQNWTGLFYMPSVNLKLDSLSEWGSFNVALSVNQLIMKSLSSVMVPYSWTPYNASQPIAWPSTTTTSTSTQNVQHQNHNDGYLND